MNIPMMDLRALILLTSLALLPGCGGNSNDTERGNTQSKPTICESAVVHLSDCLEASAGELSLPYNENQCDEEGASAVLNQDCTDLKASMLDAKADTFEEKKASLGCNLGFYALCDVPECNPEDNEADLLDVAETADDTNLQYNSVCAEEALNYQGCGACSYYGCLEEEMNCGENGYLLHFAREYCLRYRLVSEPLASPEGAAWLMRVRRCLIEELDAAYPFKSCSQLEKVGFDSHPNCYVDTGFCELSVSDWLAVLATIKSSDFSFREMLVAGNLCLNRWLNPAK